jgi:hypothetical protein
MLAERQGTKGLPEIEDEDRIERLVRFDGQHTFFFGNAVSETVCSHPVRSCKLFDCMLWESEKLSRQEKMSPKARSR